MSAIPLVTDRISQILACLNLSKNDKEIISTEENSLLTEMIRNSNAINLLGGSDVKPVFAEIKQWMSVSQIMSIEDLSRINACLFMKSYLIGHEFTVADAAVFVAIRSKFCSSVADYPELSRWYDHIQHICPCSDSELLIFGSSSHLMCLPNPLESVSSSSTIAPVPIMSGEKANEGKTVALIIEAKEEKKEEKKEKKEVKEKKIEEVVEPSSDELDPSKLDIRVGVVVKCWNHPESDKLLCEEIDVGEAVVRTIASGIRPHYAAEDLVNKKVCVLANLKDRSLAGFKSQGMVLCAVSADHSVIKLLLAPEEAKAGDKITFPGYVGESASAAQMAKKKILEKLAPQLKTNASGVALWGSSPFTIPGGQIVADTLLPDAVVS
jgi:methionine--tRNA ligase beta chain